MYSDKRSILELSYQYQREWRFEKDRQLITEALKQFPDWAYLHQRMEWHSRPFFHYDATKSKVQPRSLLKAARNVNFIPKQQTIDTLCFVTGTNSNSPHFEMTLELIESIKATQNYKNVPIHIFDFGLTTDHIKILTQHFGAIIKKPEEILDFSTFRPDHLNNLARKSEYCRGNMSTVFPGFEYYYWLDCDTWVQDENALDKMVFYAEKQGMSASIVFTNGYWGPGHFRNPLYGEGISKEDYDQYLMRKRIFHDDMICVRKDVAEHMTHYTHKQNKTYMVHSSVFLHLTFYKHTTSPSYVIDDPSHHFGAIFASGAWTKDGFLYSSQHQPIGIVSLMGHVKRYPYYTLFPSEINRNTQEPLNASKELEKQPTDIAEESAYQLSAGNGWKHDSYRFRRYTMNPEELYGALDSNVE